MSVIFYYNQGAIRIFLVCAGRTRAPRSQEYPNPRTGIERYNIFLLDVTGFFIFRLMRFNVITYHRCTLSLPISRLLLVNRTCCCVAWSCELYTIWQNVVLLCRCCLSIYTTIYSFVKFSLFPSFVQSNNLHQVFLLICYIPFQIK